MCHTVDRVRACISIHALLAESDVVDTLILAGSVLFLSTLSLRRATIQAMGRLKVLLFLSTLSLRRATGYERYCIHAQVISIHALLAESDQQAAYSFLADGRISIHALLAESDRFSYL